VKLIARDLTNRPNQTHFGYGTDKGVREVRELRHLLIEESVGGVKIASVLLGELVGQHAIFAALLRIDRRGCFEGIVDIVVKVGLSDDSSASIRFPELQIGVVDVLRVRQLLDLLKINLEIS
jgi:hypothetical protein